MLILQQEVVFNLARLINYYLLIILHGNACKTAHLVAMLINGQSLAYQAALRPNLLSFKHMQLTTIILAQFNAIILIILMMQI